MVDLINHKELAVSRLATQYKESINLINYIKALLTEADTLEEVFQDLLEKRWIDTAEGVNLDIIGVIVGQSRGVADADAFEYFGFLPNVIAKSFGKFGDPLIGARFRSFGEPIVGVRFLSDNEYRAFIRARILRNYTKSTPEDIIAQIKFVFDIDLVLLTEGTTSYSISLSKLLSNSEKFLLQNDIIPKTAGVSVSYVVEFDNENFFGFLGIPGAKGFGTHVEETDDGKFAGLI